jgi:uncharacterized membrane protein YccC
MVSMTERVNSVMIYMAKCSFGALIVFLLARLFHYADIGWCVISVMLVLSPDGKDALTLAMNRIKANLCGAGVGLLALWVANGSIWSISIALALTVLFCDLLKLSTSTRSALAATIIVMLHQEGRHVWDTALERIISVLAGCAIGLLVTFLFHFSIQPGIRQEGPGQQEA